MIKTSEKTIDLFSDPRLNALSPFQETLYWRLRSFLACSGAEETSAEPSSVKSSLYPLKRDLRESQVQSALTALTLAGMIAVYPDDTGHPYLRLIGAGSPTSHGGDYRGGGGRGGGCSYETVSSSSESNGEDGETIVNPTNANSNWDTNKQGDAAYLGLTSEDVQASMERYQKVEEAANHYGLNASHGCVQDALELADAYSIDWLLKAMKLARDAKWKWKFVESQLARWKEEGGPDSTEKAQDTSAQRSGRSSLRRSKKTDAELDEELKKWGVNLGD